jgi:hypothetical protein
LLHLPEQIEQGVQFSTDGGRSIGSKKLRGLLASYGWNLAQERKDLNTSRLYLDLAHECFNKAATAEQADAAEVF